MRSLAAGVAVAIMIGGGVFVGAPTPVRAESFGGVAVARSEVAEHAVSGRGGERAGDSTAGSWTWPVEGAVVSRRYVAPATRYAAGHRGIDLVTSVGATITAPAAGTVVFVGRVVDRGVMTLDVGGGVIVSVEPVSTTLSPGDVVQRGDPMGSVDVGGHALHGEVHLGVRVDGEYVDPMRFFGGSRRAILLPCC